VKRELSILSHQQLDSTSTNRQNVVAIYAANNTWYNVTANIDETIGMLDIYKCLYMYSAFTGAGLSDAMSLSPAPQFAN